MVKVGILDADSQVAGEIIRILIHHPETEIVCLHAPAQLGRNVSSIHHGLIGEATLKFSDKINPNDIDLLIIPEISDLSGKIMSKYFENKDVHVITISKKNFESINEENLEIGLSEINRKALVRGARKAYISSPAISSALVALVPLANYLLLNSDIDIVTSLPEDLSNIINVTIEEEELRNLLKKYQTSFHSKIKLKIDNSFSDRASVTTIRLQNNLALDAIEKIYDEIYDDHNFTFITHSEISIKDVIGTQKIIISIEKPSSELLEIKIVSDARMRGGAGDIVHVLNLFFGLHEKTGLNLKASCY